MRSPIFYLAAVLAAALATAFSAPLLIDWNAYRSDIERYAYAGTGRPLKASGDVSVRLLPQPTLRIDEVFSGDSWEARSLLVRLRPAALLGGAIRIRDLELYRPTFRIESVADDVLEGGLLLSRSARSALGRLEIEAARVREGRAIVSPQGDGDSETLLSDVDAEASLLSPSGPLRARGSFSFGGRRYVFSARAGGASERDETLPLRTTLSLDRSGDVVSREADVSLLFDGVYERDSATPLSGSLDFSASASRYVDVFEGDEESSSGPLRERASVEVRGDLRGDFSSFVMPKAELSLLVGDDRELSLSGALQFRSAEEGYALDASLEATRIEVDRLFSRLAPFVDVESGSGVASVLSRLPKGMRASLSASALSARFLEGDFDSPSLKATATSEGFEIEEFSGFMPGRAEFFIEGLYRPSPHSFLGGFAIEALNGAGLASWLLGDSSSFGATGSFEASGEASFLEGEARLSNVSFSFPGGGGEGSYARLSDGRAETSLTVTSDGLNLDDWLLNGGSSLRDAARRWGMERMDLEVSSRGATWRGDSFDEASGRFFISPTLTEIDRFEAHDSSFRMEARGGASEDEVQLAVSFSARDASVLSRRWGISLSSDASSGLSSLGAISIDGRFRSMRSSEDDECSSFVGGGEWGGGELRLDVGEDFSCRVGVEESYRLDASLSDADVSRLASFFGSSAPSSLGGFEFRLLGSPSGGMEADVSARIDDFRAAFFGSATFSGWGSVGSASGEFRLESGGIRSFGIPYAGGGRSFSASGSFQGGDGKYSIADARVVSEDEEVLRFAGGLDLSGDRPLLSGDIRLGMLSPSSALSGLLIDDVVGASDDWNEFWSASRFAPRRLEVFDVDASVSAERLGSHLRDVSGHASLSGGRLFLRGFTGRLADESSSSPLSFSLEAGRLGEEMRIGGALRLGDDEGAPLRLLSASLGSSDESSVSPLRGRLVLDVRFSGSARSPLGFASGVRGEGGWRLCDIEVSGVSADSDFDAMLRDIRDEEDMNEALGSFRRGSIRPRCAAGSVSAGEGLASFSESELIGIEGASGYVSARFDLLSMALDSAWRLKPFSSASGDGIPSFEIAVSGPLNGLRRVYDFTALRDYLSSERLRRNLDALRELREAEARLEAEARRVEREELDAARRRLESERRSLRMERESLEALRRGAVDSVALPEEDSP